MREREIRQRGSPRAISSSIQDYIRRVAPEPEVLKIIGDESRANGTDRITSEEIDLIIRDARAQKKIEAQMSQKALRQVGWTVSHLRRLLLCAFIPTAYAVGYFCAAPPALIRRRCVTFRGDRRYAATRGPNKARNGRSEKAGVGVASRMLPPVGWRADGAFAFDRHAGEACLRAGFDQRWRRGRN